VTYHRQGAGPLTAADLDGDGMVDMAVIGIGGGQAGLSLFYGNGDGTFEPPTDLALGDGITEVVCADLNGDERLDIILAHSTSHRIILLINQGDRIYAPAVYYAVGTTPIALTTADLNEDGRLDLAVSNHHSNNLCVLLNRGDGTFDAPVFYPGGSYTARVVSGDFNRDGHADLAMSNYVSGNVLVYRGDGTGRLTVIGDYRVGAYPAMILTHDFDRDGILDLATADTFSHTISVLKGNGDGTFQAPVTYAGNTYPHLMAAVDLDGDNDPDLVTPNNGTSYFSVLENLGPGTFGAAVQVPSGGSNTRTLTVGDFNRDGRPDVAVGNESTSTVSVLINNTEGTTPHLPAPLPPGHFSARLVQNAANGHWYLAVSAPNGINWDTARRAAQSVYYAGARGRLATITSPEENEFLLSQMPEVLSMHLWLGGFQPDSNMARNAGWSWVTGEPFTFTYWDGPEPNDYFGPGSEDALQIWPGTGGRWNDNRRSARLTGYLVEFESAPPADPPAAPTSLVGEAVSPWQIELTWGDNSDNETAFALFRKSGDSDWTRIAVLSANTTRYTDRGLTPETGHTYRVRAAHDTAASAWSNEAEVTTPPDPLAPPAGLVATPVSRIRINLTWTDNSTSETGFEIQRKSGSGGFWRIATVGPNVTTFSDRDQVNTTSGGLLQRRVYSYRVRAIGDSRMSAWSNEASATTEFLQPPAAPTDLVVSPIEGFSTKLLLTWTDNSDRETSFWVMRLWHTGVYAPIAELGPNVTQFTDQGLQPGTSYSYVVIAMSYEDQSPWTGASGRTPDGPPPPADPTDLTVRAASATQLDLTWSDNSDNETAFVLFRLNDQGEWVRLAVLAPNTIRYEDRGLSPVTTRTYRLRAINEQGPSAWTNEAAGTTLPPPPGAPSGLSVTAGSPQLFVLNWSDGSTDETAFAIFRRAGAGDWTRIGVVPANVATYSDRDLRPDTTYTYRVRAANDHSVSAWSNEAGAATPPAPPAPPAGLRVNAISHTALALSWSDHSSDETAFVIWRRQGESDWVRCGVVPPDTTHFTDGGLQPLTLYTYRVRAIRDGDASAWTPEVSGMTLLAPPAAPSDLRIVVAAPHQITLAWQDNSGDETSFELWRQTNGGAFIRIAILSPNVTVHLDNMVTPGASYTYRLRALGPGGASDWSNDAQWPVPSAP
jgi:hypothetical protein